MLSHIVNFVSESLHVYASCIYLPCLSCVLTIVGTSSSHVKKNPKKKVVTKKAIEGETNMHVVRVMRLNSTRGADGQAGGASHKENLIHTGKLYA